MILKLCMDFAASSPCKDRAARAVLRAGLMRGVALFILASALDGRRPMSALVDLLLADIGTDALREVGED